MLLPADRILKSLAAECRRVIGRTGAELMGSSQQSIDLAVRLLRGREAGAMVSLRMRIERLIEAIQPLLGALPNAVSSPLLFELREIGACSLDGRLSSEEAWLKILHKVESLAGGAGKVIREPRLQQQIAKALTSWEVAELHGQLAGDDSTNALNPDIDAGRMTTYLRDRFDDPTIVVTSMRTLMGGFGKQTYLFAVDGDALAGEFVLRRDADLPIIDNDCHRVHLEYLLICAVRARDFPAPDALWVDTEHELIPGGDFLVMRRASGMPGGSVFGANGAVPTGFSETLAKILAQLHSLPMMPELAQLNESINHSVWNMPLKACAAHYIESFRSVFLGNLHLPSPAILAQFDWLLDNLPVMSGQPVLLHGDIGFHNMLFDEERLSVVLDWEFSHLGDPAEDLAYVRNTIGCSLDWDAFLSTYRSAGGLEVSEQRLHAFQVWGHLRNACAANLSVTRFAEGSIEDLKLVSLLYSYIPQFLGAAQAEIDAGYK